MATVLVADDERVIRGLITAALSSEHTVIEAADGHEAWALLQRRRPEVALLDLHMGGPSGLELTRAMRGDPRLTGTRVVLLTGDALAAHAAVTAGADGYLLKPFTVRALRAALAPMCDAA